MPSSGPLAPHPIAIIGGGIVGLTLAQALKKANISCTVYERDQAIESERGGGWAITIHWALSALEDCLPEALFQQLAEIQVDPEQGKRDTGRFLFLNAADAVPKYVIPPSKRMRVNRRLLRLLLAENIDVQYDKSLASVEASEDGERATVCFTDGSTIDAGLVIGCDGANSKMRHLLYSHDSDLADLNQLPVRGMGVTIRLSPEQVKPLLTIDPLLFQGSHPETGVFLWFSLVSTPPLNKSEDTENPYFEGQLYMSWLHKSTSDDVPDTDAARRQKMRTMAANMEMRLRDAVFTIPEDAEIKEIKLADWPAQLWPSLDGRVTLAGDAAHAMTMYRGEAFNHGVTDAALLAKKVQLAYSSNDLTSLRAAVAEYEQEVTARTHDAVLLSRQATFDAHDLDNLDPDSPLVSKRAKVREPAKVA